jgi:hypothetical protein
MIYGIRSLQYHGLRNLSEFISVQNNRAVREIKIELNDYKKIWFIQIKYT